MHTLAPPSHRAPLSPQGPALDWWDSGVAAVAREGLDLANLPYSPTRRPHPHMARTRAGGVGCSRRSVGESGQHKPTPRYHCPPPPPPTPHRTH